MVCTVAVLSGALLHAWVLVTKAGQRIETYTRLFVITQQIARDMITAPYKISDWVSLQKDNVAWKQKYLAVVTYRWYFDKEHKLPRARLWREESGVVGAVADGLDEVVFDVDLQGDRIYGIWCTLSKKSVTVRRYIPLVENSIICTY